MLWNYLSDDKIKRKAESSRIKPFPMRLHSFLWEELTEYPVLVINGLINNNPHVTKSVTHARNRCSKCINKKMNVFTYR